MRSRIPRAGVLALLPVLALAGVLLHGSAAATDEGDGRKPTAWEEVIRRDPSAVDDDTLGPLDRKVLHAVTPGQAQALAEGAAAAEIVLDSGQTLAEYLRDSVGGGPGLVYVPVDLCRLFATSAQTVPVSGRMAADEIRAYVARGAGTAHTDQGGMPAGCGIPDEALAALIHFRVVPDRIQDAFGFFKAWRSDLPEPSTRILDYEPVIDPPLADRFRFNTATVVELCDSTPLEARAAVCAAEFKVKTAQLGAHVRGDVAGYFRLAERADVPEAGDADTLDGMDSTAFAAASHTHDGGDIVSGTVGEPYVDSLIARDDEIVPTVLANDGAGSGLDADLLDGKHASAFRPRPANVIQVHPTDGDFATIQGALDAIGVDPRFPAASVTNRYLIRVGGGVYNEQVTMDPFVDIEGKGKTATIVSAASQPGPEGTLECADDAEVRNLTVESTGAGEKAIAIRCLGASPMLTDVKAVATGATGGTPENIGILNDGAAAMPMLTGVHVDANPSPGLGVVNLNGAMPTIRDSDITGADSAIENRDTATAKVANTALAGGADVLPPALQASYMCVRAYVAGTLAALNAECFPNTPPTATDDAYATLGNTLLEVTLDHAGAASLANTTASQPSVIGETTTPKTYRSVFENDTDAETADKNLLTAAAVGGTVTAGAVVNMFADGTFEYVPPVGATGTDTFDYTVTDPGGLADTGTVTITLGDLIWYVDNDNGGTADGRSTTPYTTLAPIDAGGGDDGKDGAGDTIFVFDGTGNTVGGILLEDNQLLQGHEIALAPAGFEYAGGANLVAASTAPTITDGAGDVIELASGNTIRGLDIAATNGLAITGNGVAGATIDEVGTSGTGTGNGVLFDGVTGTIAMTDLDINSSTNWGIAIQNSSATFTFDAASSITNPTGVAFSVTNGAPNVTYSGTIANTSIQTIGVSTTTGGTVLFDGASINGTRIYLTSVGGDVTVDADATTLSNSFMSGIEITSASTGTFRFDDVTISTPTDEGIEINGGAGDAFTGAADFNNVDVTSASALPAVSIVGLGGGSVDFDAASTITSTNGGIGITSNAGGTITFNGFVDLDTAGLAAVNATSNTGAMINFAGNLDIDTTSGTGFNVTGGGTVNVDSSTSSTTVDTGTGIGVNIGAGIGATGVSFDTVNVNGSTAGIILANTGTGTFNVTTGTIQNITGGGVAAAEFGDVDGTVNIGASLSNSGGHSVVIDSGSAGTFTFTGPIDDNAQGIDISINGAGGTFTFAGGLDIDTIDTNTGFDAFSGGTVNVCSDSNCSAPGGTPVVNTVDTTAGTGTAVLIDSVTIGGEGVTFRSIDVDGSGTATNPAIRLDTTGAGGFTVTGIDGPCGKPGDSDCDGGTLENIQGDAIHLENTDGPVSLSYMLIEDIGSTAGGFDVLSGHDAIHGESVDGGLTLDNVTIRRISDMAVNGTLFSPVGPMFDPTTVWNGLTITDSHIANTNRFDPALTSVADDSDEGGVRILGLRGTTLLDGNVFERGGNLVQFFVTSATGPLLPTTTITVTENDFKEAYKEFASGGTLSKGITCLDVIAQDTGNVDLTVGSRATAVVGHQANDDGNLFLNCHGASLRYGNDSVSPFGLPAHTGSVSRRRGQQHLPIHRPRQRPVGRLRLPARLPAGDHPRHRYRDPRHADLVQPLRRGLLRGRSGAAQPRLRGRHPPGEGRLQHLRLAGPRAVVRARRFERQRRGPVPRQQRDPGRVLLGRPERRRRRVRSGRWQSVHAHGGEPRGRGLLRPRRVRHRLGAERGRPRHGDHRRHVRPRGRLLHDRRDRADPHRQHRRRRHHLRLPRGQHLAQRLRAGGGQRHAGAGAGRLGFDRPGDGAG